MLDAHDAEMRVLIGCGKYCTVSRGGSDVKALGARVRRVHKRLSAKDYTIGIHIFSHLFEMQSRRDEPVTKVPWLNR